MLLTIISGNPNVKKLVIVILFLLLYANFWQPFSDFNSWVFNHCKTLSRIKYFYIFENRNIPILKMTIRSTILSQIFAPSFLSRLPTLLAEIN